MLYADDGVFRQRDKDGTLFQVSSIRFIAGTWGTYEVLLQYVLLVFTAKLQA